MADRLDAALAARGLSRSRSHAAELIAGGLVSVNERPVLKPSTRVSPDDRIVVAEHDHYVSRAAHKLIAGLDAFSVDPAGSVALDVGASTGGFTQVLLERGASHVVALDVGHGQLAESIRADERVRVVEGQNVRDLDRPLLDRLTAGRAPGLVVGDLSFISLRTVLPPLVGAVGHGADYVLLVKPQFEVGRTGVREGLVRDRALRREAIEGVLWAAFDLGLRAVGIISSPLLGGSGNREYLVHLSATPGSDPSEWADTLTALSEE